MPCVQEGLPPVPSLAGHTETDVLLHSEYDELLPEVGVAELQVVGVAGLHGAPLGVVGLKRPVLGVAGLQRAVPGVAGLQRAVPGVAGLQRLVLGVAGLQRVVLGVAVEEVVVTLRLEPLPCCHGNHEVEVES